MKLSRLDIFILGACLWGTFVLILAAILDPSPENYTLGVSIILSGLYTVLLFFSRSLWLNCIQTKPIRGAVLVGSLNAAVIETLFLVVEKAFGASGVAAHPNLFLDLLITMPLYVGMVWIFVRVQSREHFPTSVVLLLGAVYELGADGIIGGLVLPGLMGSMPNLLEFLVFMVLGAFWQFIPVYSSLVLPPAWILEASQELESITNPQPLRGFLPLLWLIPFLFYAVILLVLLGNLGF